MIALERLHVQPGWLLVKLDRDRENFGRVVSLPARAGTKPKVADGECVVSIRPDYIRIAVTPENMKDLDFDEDDVVVLLPSSAIAASISPEAKKK